MSKFFDFEADFVDSLRCIPMQVRYKLDTCGVKLKLNHWHQFSETERKTLVEMPCQTELEAEKYREFLQNLVKEYTGSEAKELARLEHPPWLDAETVPTDTQIKAQEFGVDLALQQWAKLTPLQRFALIKLSRPSHENKNFYPALKEFHLI
ncbi:MAG: nitrate reductase associated protein [Oscillatoria sp. PMC 1068.18]|nr:nitrate reductase associated protein [Oscillatoria sp. PMC 1076.18]MEC4987410.1 nitrate reductase associated protein [Oscillatoria sp. PMC 1068.18]